MTILRISNEVASSFPDAVLGIVRFSGIDNHGTNTDILNALHAEETRVVERFRGTQISEHPHILPWREAYRKFGAKPKDYPSSIENLLRRTVKGHSLPHINLLVDVYNTISLRHILPVGGEDLDKIEGDIELILATDHEAPVRLLGEPEARTPRPGEVIYKDNNGAICRRWNWKEADRTKFTEETTNGLLIIEGLPPVDRALVEVAIVELAKLVSDFCGGKTTTGFLDKNHLEMLL
jgi:DNA/RNA-binding domain of Phe-tRNA-synthetase-like protein